MTLFAEPAPDDAGELVLEVRGKPQPAGSKSAFVRAGRAVVVDANPKSRPWKDQVAQAAADLMAGRALLEGPLEVEMRFYITRPQSHYGSKGLNAKGRAHPRPVTRPDLLKWARGCEDALTSVVWRDDSQIVTEVLSKHYGEVPRAVVVIRQLHTGGAAA
jgi:Holliday junction resolvase RusA-like endonuclease